MRGPAPDSGHSVRRGRGIRQGSYEKGLSHGWRSYARRRLPEGRPFTVSIVTPQGAYRERPSGALRLPRGCGLRKVRGAAALFVL